MPTCPDCQVLMDRLKDTSRYEVIDIGSHVFHMKQFIHLRDTSPAMEEARRNGWVGIPCFVLEDGTVTLDPKEAGLA